MNPCPCGYHGHYNGRCRCTPDQVARYRGKLSGPLLDRIDMTLEVPALKDGELAAPANGDTSATVATRVSNARARQLARQGKPNSALSPSEIDAHCTPDETGAALLRAATQKFNFSARAYHRVLKLARTVADMAGVESVAAAHVAEAIAYRRQLAN